MSLLSEKNSLLLIIDVQEKLLNAVFNKDTLKKHAEIMVKAAAILHIPAVITEQYPKGLGASVDVIKNVYTKPAAYFEKTSFSALENPDIINTIVKSKKRQIVVFGIETHICVSQTINSLVEKGYEVYVISDACGSRSELEHNAGIDRIKSNGGKIITTEIALFEWLRSSKHVKFKEVQSLIK